VLNAGHFANFAQNWLSWQRPLRNRKKTGSDRQHSRKYLPFGEKIVKIGPVDPHLALLNLKTKKEMEDKIYCTVSRFAERAELYIIKLYDRSKKIIVLVGEPNSTHVGACLTTPVVYVLTSPLPLVVKQIVSVIYALFRLHTSCLLRH